MTLTNVSHCCEHDFSTIFYQPAEESLLDARDYRMVGKSTTYANIIYRDLFFEIIKNLDDDTKSSKIAEIQTIGYSLEGKSISEIALVVFPKNKLDNARQKILRQIKVFNEDPSLWGKKISVGWTKNKIFSSIFEMHEEFLHTKRPSKEFNFSYVEKENSALASAISNKKIKWSEVLLGADLDPTCHIGQFSYGQNNKERQDTFVTIIQNLVELFAVESLNDNAMNSDELVSIPSKTKISLSDHCLVSGCQKFQLTKRSIYAQGRRMFGSWSEALSHCNIDYDEQVLRRPASYTEIGVIEALDAWDKERNGKWTVMELRDNVSLEKAIRNSRTNKTRSLPFSGKSEDIIFVAWVNLIYFREHGFIHQDEQWWEENKLILESTDDFENPKSFASHRAQETWDEEKIIRGLHTIYARGPSISRLSRHHIERSDFSEDKTVWSALRQNRFRTEGKFENDWLEDAGFIADRLQKLYQELDQPFTTGEAADKFAELLTQSILFEENRLTREYVSKHDPEFHNFLINRFGSWENSLRYFGLDPKFFSLTASKRAKRGYQFQSFVKEMFIKYGLNSVSELDGKNDFVYNKAIVGCGHDISCRPDFFFRNFIIDTKTGYHASQKPEQLKRYKEHSERVIILVLNGSSRNEFIDGQEIEVWSFKDFIKASATLIGVSIPDVENGELSKTLKRNPYWS